MDVREKVKILEALRNRMEKDKNLPLRENATNLVFGVGNPDADIMFIGEGPGFWEDKKGEPFVGNAGAFLNQLLSGIGIRREEIYITNVVHYRPPGNRDPELDEIRAFQPYLDEIIKTVGPKIIVTLGRFSMGKFLPGSRISDVHGKKFEINWQGRKLVIVPMYHPAAGLRNVEIKEQLFEDFKKLSKIIAEVNRKVKTEGEQLSIL